MRIEGTTAVVTGGASGLGAAAARRLAAGSANVAILDLDETGGAAVAHETGGIFVRCDVASGPDVEAALAEVADAYGPARVVVCCAGILRIGSVVSAAGPFPLTTFDEVVRTNLTGTFNCVRLAAWAMRDLDALEDGERGVLVTTSSMAAFDGLDGGVAYAAAKGGVAAMTLSAARDLARMGVRVVCIAPGSFATPMMREASPTYAAEVAAFTPFPGRLGDPDEFAALVEHACENRFLNGSVLRIDGGQRLAPSQRFR